MSLHTKVRLEMDSKVLEDLEFDRLIGKELSKPSGLADEDLVFRQSIPHISREYEIQLLEEQQAQKIDSKFLESYLENNNGFQSHLLKLIVSETKDVHPRLLPPPPVPQFIPPEQPKMNRRGM